MAGKTGQSAISFEPLLKEVVRLLKDHVTSELSDVAKPDQVRAPAVHIRRMFYAPSCQDLTYFGPRQVLIGLLKLCMTLLREPTFQAYAGSRKHGDLVREIFQQFLFQDDFDGIFLPLQRVSFVFFFS